MRLLALNNSSLLLPDDDLEVITNPTGFRESVERMRVWRGLEPVRLGVGLEGSSSWYPAIPSDRF